MRQENEDARAALANAGRTVREVLEGAGGWRTVARSYAMLLVTLVSLFMLPASVYELYRVDAVSKWQPVQARVESVELVRPAFGRGQSVWRWRFRDPATGKAMETGDLQPGDFPFSALGWSTYDTAADAWRARTGQTVTVWRSPDGKEFYPEQGSPATMTVMLVLCGAYWLWIWSRRGEKPKPAG